MKITIAYQDHEKAKAAKDAEVIRQRHICSGDDVEIKQCSGRSPYSHTYLFIKEKPHKQGLDNASV